MVAQGPGPVEVAVVTDSTACLSERESARLGVTVVPLQVVVGGRAYEEGRGLTPADLASALRRHVPVSTSRPSPTTFGRAYAAAAAAGARAVVSVHLSSDMSGTYDAAVVAAKEAPVPVEVVDSRSLGLGLGFAVRSAAAAAAAGEDALTVADVAARRARGSSVAFSVATLEHLRRGGRIGAAQALLGSALQVRPILGLEDGRIVPLEKVRTTARALARLEEIALARARAVGPVDVGVQHLDDEPRARTLAERLRTALGEVVQVCEVGAVVGAHAGPGVLAVVVAPRLP